MSVCECVSACVTRNPAAGGDRSLEGQEGSSWAQVLPCPSPRTASCTTIFKPEAGRATCHHLSSMRPTPFSASTFLWENTDSLPNSAASGVMDSNQSQGCSRDPRLPGPSRGYRRGSRGASW